LEVAIRLEFQLILNDIKPNLAKNLVKLGIFLEIT